MALLGFGLSLVLLHLCTSQRADLAQITCDDMPTGCSTVRPTNCPTQRVKQWLPQSSGGIPAACGACYYCRPPVVRADNRAPCPQGICPLIAPTCNRIEPVIRRHDGRRCRGCSRCVSHSVCPPLDCPRVIPGCEVYSPSYRYIDTHLCKDCNVCARYKSDFVRPPSTPLPCPDFELADCVLSHKCRVYEQQWVNMGENRRCQVCPLCTEWKDPNDDDNALTAAETPADTSAASSQSLVASQRATTESVSTPWCPDAIRCSLPQNCVRSEQVLRQTLGGHFCRECDRCVRNAADEGNDETACPSLEDCPSIAECEGNVTQPSNTEGGCPVCPTCVNNSLSVSNNACPPLGCPETDQSGSECMRSRYGIENINGNNCLVCRCIESAEAVATCPDLNCPVIHCTQQRTVLQRVNGVNCADCPVCISQNDRNSVDQGNDQAAPDVKDDRRDAVDEAVSVVVVPSCSSIAQFMYCPAVSCTISVRDTLTINGTRCLGCRRCVNVVPPMCPTFQCPSIHCNDNEDVHAGRRYRQKQHWEVNGEVCEGCDECVQCSVSDCPMLDISCRQYTRYTNSEGCLACPVCEIWDNRDGPPLYERTGFLQSVSTAMCMTSKNTASSTSNELIVDQCQFNDPLQGHKQVWTFKSNGQIQDQSSGLCIAYNSGYNILIMTSCVDGDNSMIWKMVKDRRYPQFFHVEHRQRENQCIDAIGQSSRNFKIALRLVNCQPFEKTDGAWSDQWWKFEEYMEQN